MPNSTAVQSTFSPVDILWGVQKGLCSLLGASTQATETDRCCLAKEKSAWACSLLAAQRWSEWICHQTRANDGIKLTAASPLQSIIYSPLRHGTRRSSRSVTQADPTYQHPLSVCIAGLSGSSGALHAIPHAPLHDYTTTRLHAGSARELSLQLETTVHVRNHSRAAGGPCFHLEA